MRYLMLMTILGTLATSIGAFAEYTQSDGSATVCKNGLGLFSIKGALAKLEARRAAIRKAEDLFAQNCDKANGFIWGNLTTNTRCSAPFGSEGAKKRELCVTCKARTTGLCG